jgi:predicted MFS family arabinose efflux permease
VSPAPDLPAPPPITPDAAARRRAVPLILATMMCVHGAMSATRVTATLWLLKNGWSEWAIGLLLSLYAVAPIALALWAGRLADRRGFHRPAQVALGMALAGAALALAFQHAAALMFAAVLTGGAVAVAGVAVQREAGAAARDASDLKRVFAWVAMGPALSNAVAPVASGLLIDHVGFRAAFGLAVLLPLIGWALAARVPVRVPAAGAHAAAAGTVWALLRDPALRRLLLVSVAIAACWDAHTFTAPVIGHARGLSASSIGLVLGSFSVATLAVRWAITNWADHLNEVRMLRSAMVVIVAVLVVYVWLPGAPGMMLGSALLGMALGSVQPMVLSLLHQCTPPHRHGQALGLRMMLTNTATVAMPLGFGFVASAATAAGPMWLMAGIVTLAMWPARRLGVDR